MGKIKYARDILFWSKPNVLNSYYAGLLAADGTLYKDSRNRTSLSIELTEKDKMLLTWFRVNIAYAGPLLYTPSRTYTYKDGRVSNKNPTWQLRINSVDQYFSDLYKWYKLTPRKSLTLEPPNITEIDHIKAFIVGYFDGDGSLMWRDDRNYYSISIVGTEMFLQWMQEFLEFYTKDQYRLRNVDNYWILEKDGTGACRFIEFLSSLSLPRLDRKWNMQAVKDRKIYNANNSSYRHYSEVRQAA
jgi:hypothetical protein